LRPLRKRICGLALASTSARQPDVAVNDQPAGKLDFAAAALKAGTDKVKLMALVP
jgi:hypothetical protein